MGCVQQAVLDFDDEVQAPWRPRLVAVADEGGPAAPVLRPRPSGRSSARVGVCRPPEPAARPGGLPRGAASRGRPSPGMPLSSGSSVAVTPLRTTDRRRPVGGSSSAAGLRLTRRARRLAVVVALAAGVAIGSWLGPLVAGGGDDLRLAGVQSVVVQPGDTLWSIAAAAAGTGDVRQVVDRIQEMNGLQDTVLIPGQVLELP